MVTGDSDLLQLVSPTVRVALASGAQRQKVYDVAAVRERYGGLGPDAVPDLKAIQGDKSDNIPGVKGIGAKNAIRLLTEFGSLEGIYERLEDVTPPQVPEGAGGRPGDVGARQAAHHHSPRRSYRA